VATGARIVEVLDLASMGYVGGLTSTPIRSFRRSSATLKTQLRCYARNNTSIGPQARHGMHGVASQGVGSAWPGRYGAPRRAGRLARRFS